MKCSQTTHICNNVAMINRGGHGHEGDMSRGTWRWHGKVSLVNSLVHPVALHAVQLDPNVAKHDVGTHRPAVVVLTAYPLLQPESLWEEWGEEWLNDMYEYRVM
jgi:hypothetical protein